jgi:hypothetical protein
MLHRPNCFRRSGERHSPRSPPSNKPYLDSSRKLNFTLDPIGAEVPTAVVSPASVRGAGSGP